MVSRCFQSFQVSQRYAEKRKNGDTVCQLIDSREGQALAAPRVIIGTQQTQRLRGSVALPTTDNPSAWY